MPIKTPEAEVKTLTKEISPFIAKTQKVTISNDKQMKQASEMRTQLKAYAKQVKEKKETVTKPAYAAYKAGMALFETVEKEVKEALSFIDRAMIDYQTEQTRIADEKKAAIEDRVGSGKGKLRIDTAVAQIDAVDTPDKKISTTSGGTEFIATRCFEVTDVSILPKEFILPDEIKIRAAMKLGTELDGVKYWTEQRPRNTK